MIANKEMQNLLNELNLNKIKPSSKYSIMEKKNISGESFYYVSNFCGISIENISGSGKQLTDLEWDGNEIYISSSDNLKILLEDALSVLKQWQLQMEKEYKDITFDITLSIDDGIEFEVTPSATIRFYCVRENYHIIESNIKTLNKFDQPILVEYISSTVFKK